MRRTESAAFSRMAGGTSFPIHARHRSVLALPSSVIGTCCLYRPVQPSRLLTQSTPQSDAKLLPCAGPLEFGSLCGRSNAGGAIKVAQQFGSTRNPAMSTNQFHFNERSSKVCPQNHHIDFETNRHPLGATMTAGVAGGISFLAPRK